MEKIGAETSEDVVAYIRSSMLRDEVGPGTRVTVQAAGNIGPRAFVKWSGAKVAQCAVNDMACIGINVEDEAKILDDSIIVALDGRVTGVANVVINDGELLKVGDDGEAAPALTSALAGVTIEDNVGLAFGNQPANDGLEIGSASASDTMQVTVYGTTNGGVTVVTETITLTGTTFVSTVKTDWGVILGFEIPLGQPTAAGTITVREASGNATVATLAAGSRQAGVINVPAASARAFDHIITVVGSGATTKTVGVIGTDALADSVIEAVVLTGATKVTFTNKFRTVTKLLVGDLESSVTATFKTDTLTDPGAVIVGRALADAAADAEFALELETGDAHAVNPVASIAVTGATETEVNFDNARYSLPADTLKVGTVVRIRAQGIHTATTGAETHVLLVKAGSTTLAATGNIDPADNDVWSIDFTMVCRAVGASGTVLGFGMAVSGPRATAAPAQHRLATGATSTSTATVDTTVAQVLAVAVDRQGTATDSDSMRCDWFSVEVIG